MAYIGTSPSNGVRRVFDYTATAGQDTFQSTDNNGQSLVYTDSAYIDVYQNGILLLPSDYQATSGTTVVLDVAAALEDTVQIVAYDVFSVADTVSASEGGSFAGNVGVGGNLDVDGTTNLDVVDIDGAVNMSTLLTAVGGITSASTYVGTVAGSASAPNFAVTSGSLGVNGMFVSDANTLRFSSAGTERMSLGSNILIGTTDNSPAEGTNNGVRLGTNGTSQFSSNGDSGLSVNRTGDNGNVMTFRRDGTLRGRIAVDGSSTSYVTSSDYRLKENVNYNFDATSRLKQLKPARFNFIGIADNTVDGFLAHEVSSIVPEAISGEKDAMFAEVLYVDGDEIPDGKKVGDVRTAPQINPQGIDQSKLVPLLVKTIQELEARITALESK